MWKWYKTQIESELSHERETAESHAWDCIEKIRFAWVKMNLNLNCSCNYCVDKRQIDQSYRMSIHSKSEKVCGFYFSISKNLRKKCVNRDDDKSAYINQKSKKCIIWTLNVKANQEVCLLWLHAMQDFSTHFGIRRCLFTFISNILQNWYFSRSQTIFLRKIPNCLRILESSESSF